MVRIVTIAHCYADHVIRQKALSVGTVKKQLQVHKTLLVIVRRFLIS